MCAPLLARLLNKRVEVLRSAARAGVPRNAADS